MARRLDRSRSGPSASGACRRASMLADERRGDGDRPARQLRRRPGDDLADRNGKRIALHRESRAADWGCGPALRREGGVHQAFFDALYDDVGDSVARSARPSRCSTTERARPRRRSPTARSRAAGGSRRGGREEARRGRAICRERGVTLPGPLADCITDVAATGNAAFADDAFAAQQAAQVSFRRLTRRRRPLQPAEPARDRRRRAARRLRGADRPVDVPHGRRAARRRRARGPGRGDRRHRLRAGPVRGPGRRLRASRPPSSPNAGPSGIYQYARGGGARGRRSGRWRPRAPPTSAGPSACSCGDGTLFSLSPLSGGSARLFRGAGTAIRGPMPTGRARTAIATRPGHRPATARAAQCGSPGCSGTARSRACSSSRSTRRPARPSDAPLAGARLVPAAGDEHADRRHRPRRAARR